jgi:aspartate 1-decarboxylase
VTVDRDLMEAADLLPGEKVHIVDINNGNRLETYVIEGAPGTGIIGINGAAARLIQVGDLVIIISYVGLTKEEHDQYSPRVVHVDSRNQIVELGEDLAAGIAAELKRGDLIEA